MQITAVEARRVLDYDPATGVFRWRVATGKRTRVGAVAGCARRDDYTRIRINGRLYLAHRLAWLHVYDEMPAMIDHRDGDRGNNRIMNLRVASYIDNARNCSGHADSKSGKKGVHWDATGKKWGARICADRKTSYLGNFDTIDEAAAAYDAAAIRLHGDFARTNGGVS